MKKRKKLLSLILMGMGVVAVSCNKNEQKIESSADPRYILAATVTMDPGTFGVFDNSYGIPVAYTMIDLTGIKNVSNVLMTGSYDVYCTTAVKDGGPNFDGVVPSSVAFQGGDATKVPCSLDLSNSATSNVSSLSFYVKVQGSNSSFYGLAPKINEFSKPSPFGSYGFTIPKTANVNYGDVAQYSTALTLGAAVINTTDRYTIVIELEANKRTSRQKITGILGSDLVEQNNPYDANIDLTLVQQEGTVYIRMYIVNETTTQAAISVALGADAQVVTIN